jgi:hypothetical protein
MTLSLAIAANAVAMFVLMGVLSYTMTRAARLRPHVPAGAAPAVLPVQRTSGAPARRSRRAPALASARA